MQHRVVPRPLAIVILDGWGISFVETGNAILQANTPSMDAFAHYYPTIALQASGIEVGLPWGEVGNSETGHTNIGLGQVHYQILPLIDEAIRSGSFFQNTVLREAVEHARKNSSRLHIMGLLSPGGVHAHSNHLYALLNLAAKMNFRDEVYLHLFTDGRDAPPTSALAYIRDLQEQIGHYGVGTIASVTGRLYAMDRNNNWERTKATYDLLTGGPRPDGAPSAEQAVQRAYDQQQNDQTIPPTAITRGGAPVATVRDNDAVVFFNFRPDRARQITHAFVDDAFTGFERTKLNNLYFACMNQYDPDIKAPAAFHEDKAPLPLAKILSDVGLTQAHVAETEKYAHITYYLNGGWEQPFPGEKHILIESSTAKNFADVPMMAAQQITDRVITEVSRGAYDIYFINFANADMVGHTGDFSATVRACEFVDTCLGRLYQAIVPGGGAMIVTADHGNAEEMIHPETGAQETDHTSSPVPFHYVYEQLRRTTPRTDEEVMAALSTPIGVLADIAPTMLDILQVDRPQTMTGISLLPTLTADASSFTPQ